MKALLLSAAAVVGLSAAARADCNLDELVGYTLIAAKSVKGYYGPGKSGDDFQGCDFGRVLIFDDDTGVTCQEFQYHYAFHPKAFIFADGTRAAICVDDQIFRVSLTVVR